MPCLLVIADVERISVKTAASSTAMNVTGVRITNRAPSAVTVAVITATVVALVALLAASAALVAVTATIIMDAAVASIAADAAVRIGRYHSRWSW